MSVIIRGMKMPESCHQCVAGYGGFCFVCPAEEDGTCPDHGRPEWCPLVELMPHGRLIDADALMENAQYKGTHDIVTAWDIVAAPTIVEADDTIKTTLFDIVEEHDHCHVQVLKNSITGEISVGWWEEKE